MASKEPKPPKAGEKSVYYDSLTTGGRPRKVLNKQGIETIEKLAAMQCTDEEIASLVDMTVDTLLNENNKEAFSEAKKRGKEKGKASIRRLQYEAAQKGNTSMLIWLGKQYLGQKDQQDVMLSDSALTINVKPASEME